MKRRVVLTALRAGVVQTREVERWRRLWWRVGFRESGRVEYTVALSEGELGRDRRVETGSSNLEAQQENAFIDCNAEAQAYQASRGALGVMPNWPGLVFE